ncbi:MAG TPA: OmpA family protein [Polyangiaceae bacterium]|nr:OmpA family protein [Polyangiaceae bacterium]
MTNRALPLLVLSCWSLVGAQGCSFSASAPGKANVAEGAEATAGAELTTDAAVEAESEAEAPSNAIVYKEGKLDYEGVINFEYNKDELRSDEATTRTLDEFAAFLKQHPEVAIEVEGHTDSRGSDDYNRRLSDRRAASVRKWLIAHGVAEARVTAVGKGEDAPQVPEPAECDDKEPADATPCEDTWAKNRRVVFRVTGGAESLPEAEPEPAPEPEPEPAPKPPPPEPAAAKECPWLWGGHLDGLGPNSWLGLAGAVQPGLCWLEPSLGLGLGTGRIEAENPPPNTTGDGRYWALNVPLRARIWFMNRHSLIGDVGIGLARYLISADMTDSAGAAADYRRNSTNVHGHLGLGYGFRPNGAQAGPRLGIVVGGLVTFNALADSTLEGGGALNAAEAAELQAALDRDSSRLDDLEPYGELSLGWLF